MCADLSKKCHRHAFIAKTCAKFSPDYLDSSNETSICQENFCSTIRICFIGIYVLFLFNFKFIEFLCHKKYSHDYDDSKFACYTSKTYLPIVLEHNSILEMINQALRIVFCLYAYQLNSSHVKTACLISDYFHFST